MKQPRFGSRVVYSTWSVDGRTQITSNLTLCVVFRKCKEKLYIEAYMSIPHIRIPRSLLEHPGVISSPNSYFRVLITIIEYAAFKPMKFDDHGIEIDILPGQLCCTIRQLAEWANVSKNDAERAIKRSRKFKIVRQEVRHTKSIITITHPETYELFKLANEAKGETSLRQERDIKEEVKKERIEKENKNTHKKKPDKPAVCVDFQLEELMLSITKFSLPFSAQALSKLAETYSISEIRTQISIYYDQFLIKKHPKPRVPIAWLKAALAETYTKQEVVL